jgi:hypothetical protein
MAKDIAGRWMQNIPLPLFGITLRIFYRGNRWKPYAHKYLNMYLFGFWPFGFMVLLPTR